MVVQVEVEAEAAARGGVLGDRPQRGLEPRFLEDVRVQLEHRIPQLSHRLGDRGVGAVERRVGGRLRRLLELVAGREEVLDGVVVECLRERLALALLCLLYTSPSPRDS